MKKKKLAAELSVKLVLIVLQATSAWSAAYKHLGCWMDTTTDPDLDGQTTVPDSLTLKGCTSYCSEAGFAYAGFKKATTCSCGNKYGRHGVSNTCNYTCEGQSLLCGGPDSNDIYYAIDSEITMRAKRDFEGYNQPKTYFEARKTCTMADGDLVVMRDPSYFNQLQTVANSSRIRSDLVWIGLFWNDNNKYIWTDPSITGLSQAASSPYWRSTEQLNHECTVMSISAKDWTTESCASQYPFICFQMPPSDVTTTANPDQSVYTEEEESKSFFEDNKKITFYLVLPLFVLCYGGSCILYAASRCWRYFKKRKRQQARDAMIAAAAMEYEPDTKPLTQSESRPLTSRDVKVEDGYTPPPPYYRVNSRASRAEKDRPLQTPLKQFRAGEEEEIKPRPMSRAVSRRSELLGNAYSEAKERRRREEQTPEPQSRPRTSRTPRTPAGDEPALPPPIPPPPEKPNKHPPRAGQYQVPLTPTTSDPDEPEIDYTKLSISDIMYIRGLMSNNGEQKKRKKPKKIIVA